MSCTNGWAWFGTGCAVGSERGGHTVNHPILARMHRDGQWREIAECGQRLAAKH